LINYIEYFALTSSQLIGDARCKHFLKGGQEMELVVKHNFSILKQSSKIAVDCMLAKAHIKKVWAFFVF